jgi:hypothetical protein
MGRWHRHIPDSIPVEMLYLVALTLSLGIALGLHQVVAGRTGLGLLFGALTLLFGVACVVLVKRPRKAAGSPPEWTQQQCERWLRGGSHRGNHDPRGLPVRRRTRDGR